MSKSNTGAVGRRHPRLVLASGQPVLVTFATGTLEGVATGESKDGLIGVVTRELSGGKYYRVTRWHEPHRVHLTEAAADQAEIKQVADLLGCFPPDIVAAGVKLYESRQNDKIHP